MQKTKMSRKFQNTKEFLCKRNNYVYSIKRAKNNREKWDFFG